MYSTTLSRAHMQMFRKAINKLFKQFFSRVFASPRPNFDSQSGHVSLRPLNQDGDDLGQVSSQCRPRYDLSCFTLNKRTCKCLMSIFRIERFASSIRPTFQCSSCTFMYVHVTTCTGESHITDSYVNVLNTYQQAVPLALFQSARLSQRRPGFNSRLGHVSLGSRDLQFRMEMTKSRCQVSS